MEVTQFTYFQQVGGLDCTPTTGEITYGLERLAMYLQGVESVYDLVWTEGHNGQRIYYRDVFHQNEVEQSTYNFEHASTDVLFAHFNDYEAEAKRIIDVPLALPAYEQTLKAAPYLQYARCPRRHQCDRARCLYWPYPQSVPRCRTGLLRLPRTPRFPHAEQHILGGQVMNASTTQPLLIELFTEELPPKALATARAGL
jgi:hypothetical protein